MAFPDPTVETIYLAPSGVLYQWDAVLEAWTILSGQYVEGTNGPAVITLNSGDLLL